MLLRDHPTLLLLFFDARSYLKTYLLHHQRFQMQSSINILDKILTLTSQNRYIKARDAQELTDSVDFEIPILGQAPSQFGPAIFNLKIFIIGIELICLRCSSTEQSLEISSEGLLFTERPACLLYSSRLLSHSSRESNSCR